jgi:hypothetical protein
MKITFEVRVVDVADGDTYYHYCEIGGGTGAALRGADLMGRIYNYNIKGNFDCQTQKTSQT